MPSTWIHSKLVFHRSTNLYILFLFFIHLWIKYCLMCICVWRRNGLLQMVRLPSFVATRWSRSRGERVRAFVFVFVCVLSLYRRKVIILLFVCMCLHASCRTFNNFYLILMSLFVFWRRRWQMIVTCNAAQTHIRAWNLNLNEVQRRARNHEYFWRRDTFANRRRSSAGTGVTHDTRTPCHRRRFSPNWMECCLKVINIVVYAIACPLCMHVVCVCVRACSRAPEDIVVSAERKEVTRRHRK